MLAELYRLALDDNGQGCGGGLFGVTARTNFRCPHVTIGMASDTIDTQMTSCKCKSCLGIMIKSRRFPGDRCMAESTIGREFCSGVGWIGSGIEIVGMTTRTNLCCPYVTVSVAFDTVDTHMPSRQCKSCFGSMVKSRRFPGGHVMALGTISWKLGRYMRGICCRIIFG